MAPKTLSFRYAEGDLDPDAPRSNQLRDVVHGPVGGWEQVGGKGGGRPDFAQAGGTDVAKLDAALKSVADWVAEQLAAVDAMSAQFDAGEQMVTRQLGPAYQYHTNLRSVVAHPTRESLNYALYLLEAGDGERAAT